jgi:hypothetical protein
MIREKDLNFEAIPPPKEADLRTASILLKWGFWACNLLQWY